MTDTHKENGTEQLVGEKYQTNIVEFPLVIQMERILREDLEVIVLGRFIDNEPTIR